MPVSTLAVQSRYIYAVYYSSDGVLLIRVENFNDMCSKIGIVNLVLIELAVFVGV